MKAVVHDRYGPPDVLRLEQVERPVPGPNDVLVRVRATTVNRTDCHRRAAAPFAWRLIAGLRRPRKQILGSELAGEVTAIGTAVTGFAVGDHVFGLSQWALGTHAEFVRMPASGLIADKPADVSFAEAAAVCDGGLNALTALRRARLRKGQQILVYGASGSIGTAAVQLANYFGANVTGVCGTKSVELVSSLGAEWVVDYTREDFTRNGRAYDVIYDAVGKQSFRRCKHSLKPGGIYLATDGWANVARSLLLSWPGRKRVVFPMGRYQHQDVLFLRQLMAHRDYRAVVDRIYALEDVVEAARYVETQQKIGNVVLVTDA
jgi:NADPH:quinone reductase-like Zn-dependent oxidoreductase